MSGPFPVLNRYQYEHCHKVNFPSYLLFFSHIIYADMAVLSIDTYTQSE